MANLRTAVELYLDARGLSTGARSAGRSFSRFSDKAKREISGLNRAIGGIRGQLAGLGVGIGGAVVLSQSARLDKSLTQIGLTAGVGADKVAQLRATLFTLAQKTGQPVEELQQGFNTLVQTGLSFDKSLATIGAINTATAVAGGNSQELARGLTVAARAFDFDLSKPGMALRLLEQMTIAGRQGNAELADLAGIFGTVGTNAAKAGMSFQQSLAFIEALSQSLPGQPEKLATRAESTLRLFTNANYLRAAEATTGIKFFEAGERRDTFAVLADMKEVVEKLDSEEARFNFLSKAFGQADKDTIIGLTEILSGANFGQMKGFVDPIKDASGTFQREIDRALNNAADQASRLKNTLRTAADNFSRPLLDVFTKGTKFLLDRDKANLSGGQLVAGGGSIAALTYIAARVGGRRLGKLFGTAGGVAAGKALEEVAGVTPVFVTNWPSGFGAGGTIADIAGMGRGGKLARRLPKTFGGFRAGAGLLASSRISSIAAMGVGAVSASAAGLLASAGIGYALGKYVINPLLELAGVTDEVGEGITHLLAAFGSDEATAALEASGANNSITKALQLALNPGGFFAQAVTDMQKNEVNGTIKIEVDATGRTHVKDLKSETPGVDINVYSGPVMHTP